MSLTIDAAPIGLKECSECTVNNAGFDTDSHTREEMVGAEIGA